MVDKKLGACYALLQIFDEPVLIESYPSIRFDEVVQMLYDMQDDGKTVRVIEIDLDYPQNSRCRLREVGDAILEHVTEIYRGNPDEIKRHPLFYDIIENHVIELDNFYGEPTTKDNY